MFHTDGTTASHASQQDPFTPTNTDTDTDTGINIDIFADTNPEGATNTDTCTQNPFTESSTTDTDWDRDTPTQIIPTYTDATPKSSRPHTIAQSESQSQSQPQSQANIKPSPRPTISPHIIPPAHIHQVKLERIQDEWNFLDLGPGPNFQLTVTLAHTILPSPTVSESITTSFAEFKKRKIMETASLRCWELKDLVADVVVQILAWPE
ncbi:hypothetical protein MKZ38_008807 [Zalerion maritima]|uniref:Uncharacterized protein n=1 Tax=Zalerion maritima TaxID=339359 RepID=A0AAD5RH87_9PEZI|nr:hypothetical protein MKZ38_008807 [Zalerion maritima]